MPEPGAARPTNESPRNSSPRNSAAQRNQDLPARVRELPGQAVRVAVIGIGHALLLSERMREEYKRARRHGLQSSLARLRHEGVGVLGRDATETTAAPLREQPAPVEPGVAKRTDDAALPVPNYDELTLPSLRARLRNLDIAQLTRLIEYEKAHAARADIISMFSNRIAKLRREGHG